MCTKLCSLLAAGIASTAGAQSGPDLALVGRLPLQCELVVAAGDLAAMRETPAGRAFERFLSEVSPWRRSVEAWGDVAAALGLPPDQAVRELCGGTLVYVAAGEGPTQSSALIGRISSQTEERLRERLRPAPRGLSGSTPILALENGAFEVATSTIPRGNDASVLVAPRGSGELFDSLLPVLRGGSGIVALSMSPVWENVKAMPQGSVLVLYRDTPAVLSELKAAEIPLPDRERFVAITASAVGSELRAAIVASEDMMVVKGAGSVPRVRQGWPAAAINYLSRDASMLLAGSPKEQPLDLDSQVEGVAVRRTLLLSAISMIRLPASIERQIDGVALIAVHKAPDPDTGVVFTAAIPTANIDAIMPEADRWAVSLVGGSAPAPAADRESIRILQPGVGAPVGGGLVGPAGVMAWNFVREPGSDGGWWVLNIRTSRSEEALAATVVREVSEMLSEPGSADDRTLFRLSLRPDQLAAMSRRNSELVFASEPPRSAPPPTEPAPDPLLAFRWLDRVESVLERSPGGLVKGRFVVRLNTSLLGD